MIYLFVTNLKKNILKKVFNLTKSKNIIRKNKL